MHILLSDIAPTLPIQFTILLHVVALLGVFCTKPFANYNNHVDLTMIINPACSLVFSLDFSAG
jgi:hypothetical protein